MMMEREIAEVVPQFGHKKFGQIWDIATKLYLA